MLFPDGSSSSDSEEDISEMSILSSGEAAFLKTLTDATGISLDEFNKAKNDEAVKALCAEWKTSYDVAKIQGIPAYVVNGKYLIMTKSIRNFDGMVNLVKELKEMK